MTTSAILFIAAIGVLKYYKPHRSVINEDAAYKIAVSSLVNEFVKDETQANARYSGKIVEVSGTVKDVIRNDSTLILLLGDSMEIAGVSCYMQPDQKEKYAILKKGGQVSVKGVCNGMLLDVVIDKAILLSYER